MAVTMTPTDLEDARRLAIRLLRAAGAERHDEVRTLWDERVGVLFVVPDDLAWGLLGMPATGSADPGGAGVGSTTVTVEPGVAVVEDSAEASTEPTEPGSPQADGSVVGASESEQVSKRASRAGVRKRAARPRVEFSER
jgi:hypothetical protein